MARDFSYQEDPNLFAELLMGRIRYGGSDISGSIEPKPYPLPERPPLLPSEEEMYEWGKDFRDKDLSRGERPGFDQRDYLQEIMKR